MEPLRAELARAKDQARNSDAITLKADEQVRGAPVVGPTNEFAKLKRQLDAADADIELVNKRLDEAHGK